VSGVKLGGRESDLTIPDCGLAIMMVLIRDQTVLTCSGGVASSEGAWQMKKQERGLGD
jgi:hypothetical protein